MPEFTVVHISLLALATIFGMVVGWVIRGKRSMKKPR